MPAQEGQAVKWLLMLAVAVWAVTSILVVRTTTGSCMASIGLAIFVLLFLWWRMR